MYATIKGKGIIYLVRDDCRDKEMVYKVLSGEFRGCTTDLVMRIEQLVILQLKKIKSIDIEYMRQFLLCDFQ